MKKQDFIEYYEGNKASLCEQFGAYLYFLSNEIITLSTIEERVSSLGYEVERKHSRNCNSYYTIIKWEGKEIGVIDIQGFPSIEIYKGNRIKHATKFAKLEGTIEPIKGVHRILDWHDVKGKFHILAGGETIIHFLPLDLSTDTVIDFLTKVELIDKVEEFKKHELNII